MYHPILFLLMALFMAGADPVLADGRSDPLIHKIMIDEFEARDAEGNTVLALDGQGWIGKDLQKVWFKAGLEKTGGEMEDLTFQALYSRAILPYWDVQIGLRQDFHPTPHRNWAVLGLQGLAPWFFEVDVALFIDEGGRIAMRFEAEYELMLTQKWIITPDIQADFYGQDDADLGVDAGLSDMELGLRLRYEIRRELAPYIGVNWNKRLAVTGAGFADNEGKETDDVQWVAGIRVWW